MAEQIPAISSSAEALVLGQLDHDVGGGGDGVGAQEEAAAALLAGGQQTPGGGHVTGDVAVAALLHLVGVGNLEDVRVHHLQLVGIFITLGQHSLVQRDDSGLLGELALQICKSMV